MLSVVICTYNREKYIYNILESVAKNTLSKDEYEIIVVDNNSNDGTKKEVIRFQKTYSDVNLHYVFEGTQGLSFARNRGIRESLGDVVIYVDDDALVNEKYLETYKSFFTLHPELCAAGGAIIPMYETSEPKWMSYYTRQLLTAYLYRGDKENKFHKGQFPGGGNSAYRKEVFYKVGYFNTELGRNGENLAGAEEKDIFDRMQSMHMNIYYLPNAVLYHIIPQYKLEESYFNKLTLSIGESERKRTLNVSRTKYCKRLVSEVVKWCATLLLFVGYTLALTPQKGYKLLIFRKNVTKGLLIK